MSEYKPLNDNGQRFDTDTYTTTWLKYPYGVQLQEDPSTAFKCIKDYENFILKGDSFNGEIDKYNEIIDSPTNQDLPGFGVNNMESDEAERTFFNASVFTDSRIGCNDAMNPYWQFNRDDDIRPTMMFPRTLAAQQTFGSSSSDAIKDGMHAIGMGRVYSETYDAQQQILWLEAGVPKFTNLLEFYRDAADSDVAEAINRGTFSNFLGRMVGTFVKGAIWAISLPVLAPFYLSRWVDMIACERVTKYYSFQPAMTMYYETVNTMLQYVAVGMGIHPMSLTQHEAGSGSSHISNGAAVVRSLDMAGAATKKEEQMVTKRVNGKIVRRKETVEVPVPASYDSMPGIPAILRDGPDIFRIMNRRARLINLNCATIRNDATVRDLINAEKDQGAGTDYFLPAQKDAKYSNDSWDFLSAAGDGVKNWYGALKGTLFGSGNHIGFRVERGVSCTENFSNSTGETGIAQKLNGVSQKYKEENESFGNSAAERIASKSLAGAGSGENPLEAALGSMSDEIKRGVLGFAANATGFDIGAVLTTGNGFLDIPEVWRSSSFSKSYSFNIQLRARYGDPVSVFQSIYIPMLMLMALAAPRAIGTNMYTSPFIVRAYCRGMFCIPIGIVDSMQITRGSDDFGWSNIFLPTSVDISFSIKDLSPTLFLSMQENGIFDTFTRNSNLLEYLDTLAALGLKERIYWWPKIMRKARTVCAVARSTIFSPTYYGMRLGQSNIGRAFSALIPFKYDDTPTK